jgi:hypothetical protein
MSSLNQTSPNLANDLITSINIAINERANIINVINKYKINEDVLPNFALLNNNKDYLLSLCNTYTIPETEFYKPEYTSNRLYGTPSLWYTILLVNNFFDSTEYTEKSILAISPSYVNEFLTFVSNNKDKNEIITYADLTLTRIPEE